MGVGFVQGLLQRNVPAAELHLAQFIRWGNGDPAVVPHAAHQAAVRHFEPVHIVGQIPLLLGPQIHRGNVLDPALGAVGGALGFFRQFKQHALYILLAGKGHVFQLHAHQGGGSTQAGFAGHTHTVDQGQAFLAGVQPQTAAHHLGIQSVRLGRPRNDDGFHAGNVGALGKYHAVDQAGDLARREPGNDPAAVGRFAGHNLGTGNAFGDLMALGHVDGKNQGGAVGQAAVRFGNGIGGALHGLAQLAGGVIPAGGMDPAQVVPDIDPLADDI